MQQNATASDWLESHGHVAFLIRFLTPQTIADLPTTLDWEAILEDEPSTLAKRFWAQGHLRFADAQAPLPDELSRHTVKDLREMLRERELPVSGRKDDLIARLIEADPEGMQKEIVPTVKLVCSQSTAKLLEQQLLEHKHSFLSRLNLPENWKTEVVKWLIGGITIGVLGSAVYDLVRDLAAQEDVEVPDTETTPTPPTEGDSHARVPSADSHYQQGRELYSQGQYHRAIAEFTMALELNDQLAQAYAWRGSCHRHLKQYQQALADFNRSLELEADSAFALRYRGEAYRLMGQYPQAIQDFNRSLELEPDSAFALRGRGVSHYRLDKETEAVADLTQSLELEPDAAFALRYRGEAYRLMGQYPQAIQDFNRSLELEPDSAFALRGRGETYRLMGQYPQALKDFNRSLELEADSAFALRYRGETYRLMGQYPQAIQDFNRSLELEPDSAFALRGRGVSHYRLDNGIQAVADLTQSLELEPDAAFALRYRGEAYRQLGQYSQALKDFSHALRNVLAKPDK